jgi:DNA-binding transcriptional ArsR family regulator
MQALEISQSKPSRGLTALYDADFLKMRKDGFWSSYSLDNEGIKDYQSKVIEAVKNALRHNKVVVLDKERLRKEERVNPKCAPGIIRGVTS